MEKLKLPKKERPIGLYIYCNKHKVYYATDSQIKCKCEKLVYKAKIHVPGSAKECKTRILGTLDFDEACIMLKSFRKELSENSFKDIIISKKSDMFTRNQMELFLEWYDNKNESDCHNTYKEELTEFLSSGLYKSSKYK